MTFQSARYRGVLVEVIQGDIRTFQSQAIVNAGNVGLRGGGGINGMIHDAAGPGLLAELAARYPGNPAGVVGGAVITGAHNIRSAEYIIHAIGPDYSRRGPGDAGIAFAHRQLHNTYYNSLRQASNIGARSIAFPAFSSGAFEFPRQEATNIALNAACEFIENENGRSLQRIVFLIYGAADLDEYGRQFPEVFFNADWGVQENEQDALDSLFGDADEEDIVDDVHYGAKNDDGALNENVASKSNGAANNGAPNEGGFECSPYEVHRHTSPGSPNSRRTSQESKSRGKKVGSQSPSSEAAGGERPTTSGKTILPPSPSDLPLTPPKARQSSQESSKNGKKQSSQSPSSATVDDKRAEEGGKHPTIGGKTALPPSPSDLPLTPPKPRRSSQESNESGYQKHRFSDSSSNGRGSQGSRTSKRRKTASCASDENGDDNRNGQGELPRGDNGAPEPSQRGVQESPSPIEPSETSTDRIPEGNSESRASTDESGSHFIETASSEHGSSEGTHSEAISQQAPGSESSGHAPPPVPAQPAGRRTCGDDGGRTKSGTLCNRAPSNGDTRCKDHKRQ